MPVILMELEKKSGRAEDHRNFRPLMENETHLKKKKTHPKAFGLLYAAGINKLNEIHKHWDVEIILPVTPKILLLILNYISDEVPFSMSDFFNADSQTFLSHSVFTRLGVIA